MRRRDRRNDRDVGRWWLAGARTPARRAASALRASLVPHVPVMRVANTETEGDADSLRAARVARDQVRRVRGSIGERRNELADSRYVLRVVQLRRDLSLPADRWGRRRTVHAWRVHGRAVVVDRAGRGGWDRPRRVARRAGVPLQRR